MISLWGCLFGFRITLITLFGSLKRGEATTDLALEARAGSKHTLVLQPFTQPSSTSSSCFHISLTLPLIDRIIPPCAHRRSCRSCKIQWRTKIFLLPPSLVKYFPPNPSVVRLCVCVCASLFSRQTFLESSFLRCLWCACMRHVRWRKLCFMCDTSSLFALITFDCTLLYAFNDLFSFFFCVGHIQALPLVPRKSSLINIAIH